MPAAEILKKLKSARRITGAAEVIARLKQREEAMTKAGIAPPTVVKTPKGQEVLAKNVPTGFQLKKFEIGPVEAKKLATAAGIEWSDDFEKPKLRIRGWRGSDERPDRHGDIVLQNFDYANFKMNPILLDTHQWESMPIGNVIGWKTLQVSGDAYSGPVTEFVLLFATKEMNPRADQMFRLASANILRAGSIGFMPKTVIEVTDRAERKLLGLGDHGLVFDDNELIEFSLCSVPANPSAISNSISRGLRDKLVLPTDEEAVETLIRGAKTMYADESEMLASVEAVSQAFVKYSDDQPRGDDGKWSSDGGSGGGSGTADAKPTRESVDLKDLYSADSRFGEKLGRSETSKALSEAKFRVQSDRITHDGKQVEVIQIARSGDDPATKSVDDAHKRFVDAGWKVTANLSGKTLSDLRGYAMKDKSGRTMVLTQYKKNDIQVALFKDKNKKSVTKYSEDQPRGDDGKWTSGGSSGDARLSENSKQPKATVSISKDRPNDPANYPGVSGEALEHISSSTLRRVLDGSERMQPVDAVDHLAKMGINIDHDGFVRGSGDVHSSLNNSSFVYLGSQVASQGRHQTFEKADHYHNGTQDGTTAPGLIVTANYSKDGIKMTVRKLRTENKSMSISKRLAALEKNQESLTSALEQLSASVVSVTKSITDGLQDVFANQKALLKTVNEDENEDEEDDDDLAGDDEDDDLDDLDESDDAEDDLEDGDEDLDDLDDDEDS